MTRIVVPTKSVEDWKSLLAQPDRQWKSGFSAIALAQAWEAAGKDGFPPEVRALLQTSGRAGWDSMRLLLAIPEFKVPLPGGSTGSQTDLLVLARAPEGLITIAVEGKVDETLGSTVAAKRAKSSAGLDKRLAYLLETLELSSCPGEVRYQLLHRAASSLLIARDFAASAAVMLVHSFSPANRWFEDFGNFAALLGGRAVSGELLYVGERSGVPLYIGWCAGDQRFLSSAGASGEQ